MNALIQYIMEHKKSIMGVFRSKGIKDDDSEDILQDIYVSLLQLNEMPPEELIPRYVYKVVHTRSNRFLIAECKAAITDAASGRDVDLVFEQLYSDDRDPLDIVELDESKRWLSDNIEAIPNDTHRHLIKLLDDGVSLPAAAESVGLKQGAARMVLSRFIRATGG